MCRHKNQFYWMQIVFLSATKGLWLPQYVNIILVSHKKFGPAQNILGTVKGQGIREIFCEFLLCFISPQFQIFFQGFSKLCICKERNHKIEVNSTYFSRLKDKMTSRFQNSTPKFKIKDENFNDCVSISTNSSISSIKSYRASIKGWKILKTNCGFLKSSKEWPYFFAYVFLP